MNSEAKLLKHANGRATQVQCRQMGILILSSLILSRGMPNAQPHSVTLICASEMVEMVEMLGHRVLKLSRKPSQVLTADCPPVADTSLWIRSLRTTTLLACRDS